MKPAQKRKNIRKKKVEKTRKFQQSTALEEKRPFDFAYLNLINPVRTESEVNFWIKIHAIISVLTYYFFINPTGASGEFLATLNSLKKFPFKDLLFFIGLACTGLMALDIYEVERFKNLEDKLKDKIYSLNKSFAESLKHAITVSNRHGIDIVDWYINSAIVISFFYFLAKNGDINFTLLHNNVYIISVFYALLASKAIIVLSQISHLTRTELFIEPISICLLINYQDKIFNYFNIQADKDIFAKYFLYLMLGYSTWLIVINFDSRKIKMFGWACAIFFSLPFFIVKLSTRCIPYILFYPIYLVVKFAAILKAKSLFRHIGFVLFIIFAIISYLFFQ